jgi:hypothetical protein
MRTRRPATTRPAETHAEPTSPGQELTRGGEGVGPGTGVARPAPAAGASVVGTATMPGFPDAPTAGGLGLTVAADSTGTGWIDTQRPSQTIDIGA